MHMYLLAAATFAITAALIAYSKGRSGFGWFLGGFLIGPFALVVAALPPLLRDGLTMKCPCCGEVVHMDVRICRYCKSDIGAARIRGPGEPPPQLPQHATVTLRERPQVDAP